MICIFFEINLVKFGIFRFFFFGFLTILTRIDLRPIKLIYWDNVIHRSIIYFILDIMNFSLFLWSLSGYTCMRKKKIVLTSLYEITKLPLSRTKSQLLLRSPFCYEIEIRFSLIFAYPEIKRVKDILILIFPICSRNGIEFIKFIKLIIKHVIKLKFEFGRFS